MADERLRILQVLRAPVGGQFRHVADLTRALAARGHEVGIVLDDSPAGEAAEARLAALAPSASLGVHRFPIPRSLGVADFTTPFKVAALARTLEVDVLHGHVAKGGFHARLARLGRREAVTLYTPHGGVLHFDPKSGSGRVFGLIERALLPLTDAVVFESGFAKAAFERQIAVPKCPTPVIHNGLEPGEFAPLMVEPDAADFVFIGELRELKGIFVLVEALKDVAVEGRPATLVVAGDGPDREALEERIGDLGLGERVSLVGVQPARAMFAKGQVVLVPSLAESLPYIVLEASAAGRPLISTRVGGIAEIFGPTADALIPPGDVAALRQAMQAAVDDPGVGETQAITRRLHVEHAFSLDGMTAQIEALYRSLIAKR